MEINGGNVAKEIETSCFPTGQTNCCFRLEIWESIFPNLPANQLKEISTLSSEMHEIVRTILWRIPHLRRFLGLKTMKKMAKHSLPIQYLYTFQLSMLSVEDTEQFVKQFGKLNNFRGIVVDSCPCQEYPGHKPLLYADQIKNHFPISIAQLMSLAPFVVSLHTQGVSFKNTKYFCDLMCELQFPRLEKIALDHTIEHRIIQYPFNRDDLIQLNHLPVTEVHVSMLTHYDRDDLFAIQFAGSYTSESWPTIECLSSLPYLKSVILNKHLPSDQLSLLKGVPIKHVYIPTLLMNDEDYDEYNRQIIDTVLQLNPQATFHISGVHALHCQNNERQEQDLTRHEVQLFKGKLEIRRKIERDYFETEGVVDYFYE